MMPPSVLTAFSVRFSSETQGLEQAHRRVDHVSPDAPCRPAPPESTTSQYAHPWKRRAGDPNTGSSLSHQRMLQGGILLPHPRSAAGSWIPPWSAATQPSITEEQSFAFVECCGKKRLSYVFLKSHAGILFIQLISKSWELTFLVC